jgi:predicted SAM-dependent methyltransferase
MKKITLSLLLIGSSTQSRQPIIQPNSNALEVLRQHNLIKSNTIKLHLGSGEQYLNGYVNIDFPPENHTVQTKSRADAFANITQLSFSKETVDEVRSHHTFEHFDRQVALAMVCAWQEWLKPNGLLVIETPDLEESVKLFMDANMGYKEKQAVLRHVFGSHEASWAYHYDGWYEEKFRHVLSQLGFDIESVEKTAWGVTRNIIVHARKNNLPYGIVINNAKQLLRESMVDHSPSEERMWQEWCKIFQKFLDTMIVS